MAGVDHQPFIIRFVDQNFQKFFPYTFSAPSDEPLMNASLLPVIRRQVTPRRSGPQYPEYCIDKTTVILGDSSPLSSPSGQMGFQLCPYIIAYIMSVTGCFHLFRSCLFMMLPFYHNPLALCRQYLRRREQSIFFLPYPTPVRHRGTVQTPVHGCQAAVWPAAGPHGAVSQERLVR